MGEKKNLYFDIILLVVITCIFSIVYRCAIKFFYESSSIIGSIMALVYPILYKKATGNDTNYFNGLFKSILVVLVALNIVIVIFILKDTLQLFHRSIKTTLSFLYFDLKYVLISEVFFVIVSYSIGYLIKGFVFKKSNVSSLKS